MASEKKMTGKKISKLEKQAKGQPSGGGVPINYDIIGKRIEKKIKKYFNDPKMQFKMSDSSSLDPDDRAIKEVARDMGASIKGLTPFKSGGRAGYKMGSKCKLAVKGKGRAYGKNS
tara:strand:+ start:445 stop:792 length:348 start_codon:yes stop_codon:yes gene_type:complete